jgi:glyoxylase-like metal-dependent hydrolase (beta-lactamase superfamily II)
MIALIRHPRLGTILFDAGYGRALEELPRAASYRKMLPFVLPEEERLERQLGGRRIDMVFLSHFHPDHIGGLREVPGAPPILHSRDGLKRLNGLRGFAARRAGFFAELLPDDFAGRALAIEDLAVATVPGWGRGFDVTADGSLIAIALPGHAAGQYGLLIDGEIFLCADAAWVRSNFTEKKLPAWPVRFLVDDYTAFVATLDRLHEFTLARPEVVVIPSHCEESIAAYGKS